MNSFKKYPATERFSSIEQAKEGYACARSPFPVIRDIDAGKAEIETFDLLEISFSLDATYENPFDPDDIRVDGIFVRPDGKTAVVPAFYIEPIESTDGKVLLTYKPFYFTICGESGWRIRFAADTEGEYSFYIKATDKKGQTAQSETFKFRAIKGNNKGFVRVSKSHPGRFENSGDSSPFYGSGTNIAWVRRPFTKDPEHLSYNYFLDKAAEQTNCTRVWICHWAWLEWTPDPEYKNTYSYCGMSYYNQCVCSAFDDIIRMCEERGLRCIVCLDDNDEHYAPNHWDNWGFNPYNIDNGGPVDGVRNYFRTKGVMPYYKKRLRYIIARWGYSSAVMSLNLWNDYFDGTDEVAEYLSELRDYTREITANWRDLLFASNFKMKANKALDYATQSLTTYDGTQPAVVNECWHSKDREWYAESLESTIWSELVRGSSTSMIWSHDVVDEENCWGIFKNILDFTSDIPFNNSSTSTAEPKIISAEVSGEIDPVKVITVRSYGDVKGWGQAATRNFFPIDSEQSSVLLEGYTPNLYSGHTEKWKNPPTFSINAPQGGRLLLEFDEIGGGKQNLTVHLNDKLVKTAAWDGGRRMLNADENCVETDLVVGENKVTLDNIGSDWLRLLGVYFILNAPSAESMVTAKQLCGKDFAIIYVENQTYYELYRTVLKKDPIPIKNVKISARGIENGDYYLYLYNPSTGEYSYIKEVCISENHLEFEIPTLEKHMVAKLIRKGISDGSVSHFKPAQLKSK